MMDTIIDFETRSECDIRKGGAFRYSEHESTEVLCLAVKKGDAPPGVWVPDHILSLIPNVKDLPLITKDDLAFMLENSARIGAHNLEFEKCIWKNIMEARHGFSPLPGEKLFCTAAKAASHSLPRKLEDAGRVLKLSRQKNMDGHAVMLKVSRPRKARKTEDPTQVYWNEKPEDVEKTIRYCLDDVEAEAELSKRLRDLRPLEREIWGLDQKINERGIHVDLPSIRSILRTIAKKENALLKEIKILTEGAITSPRQIAASVGWLNGTQGRNILAGLDKAAVQETLGHSDLNPKVRRFLEIRQSLGKSSTGKYKAILDRVSTDGRLRGAFLYHGANTGRASGRAVQPQNFPRACPKNPEYVLEAFHSEDPEWVEAVLGDCAWWGSSLIRSVFTAPSGKKLICGDFSSIEARGVFWLAGEKAGLQKYHEGADLYCDLAEAIYGRPITKADKVERQVGKMGVLGAGYGMGWARFQEQCAKSDWYIDGLDWKILEGVELDEDMAKKVITTYRGRYSSVPDLWKALEGAAFFVLENPLKRAAVADGKIVFGMDKEWLCMQLPSGRRIRYFNPKIETETKEEGKSKFKRRRITFWGTDSVTRQWVKKTTWGGTFCENAVQAFCRDFLMEAMLRLEANGYPVILHAHDEAVSEVEESFGSEEEFAEIMTVRPGWALDFPMAVETWGGVRYRK